jgi:hypothetical protein
MERSADERPIPIGRTRMIEALPLAHADDHALLVRQAGRPRALVTADPAGSNERLVVMPLDDEVEIRVDGDAIAVWLGSRPLIPTRSETVPAWASVIGLVVLLVLVAFAVIGGAVVSSWVVDVVGG